MKQLANMLSVLSSRDLSVISQVLEKVRSAGFSYDDLAAYLSSNQDAVGDSVVGRKKERRQVDAARENRKTHPPVCPDCGMPLQLVPVNVSRCTNVGGPWSTSLFCSRCKWEVLSEMNIGQILRTGRWK